MAAFTYILHCADGTFYTGWTNNLALRLVKHQNGKGAKYTRARLPVYLAYWEAFENKSDAMRREAEIKKYPRKQKLALVETMGKDLTGITG
ncbi:GIY-YIG nuclease family protein [Lachnospiraceae bacterium ZAX-1]